MRKFFFLSVCAAMLCGSSLWAAHQYGGIKVKDDGFRIGKELSLSVQFLQNRYFKNFSYFGYYVADGNGLVRYQAFDVAEASGKKFDLGDFKAGEEVKFFMANSRDEYYTGEIDYDKNRYEFEIEGGRYDDVEFKFDIKVGDYKGDETPTGQPLPGVLATMALGGAALFGAKKWKQR